MTDAMWAHVRVDATTGAPTPHLLNDHLNKVAELASGFADGYEVSVDDSDLPANVKLLRKVG